MPTTTLFDKTGAEVGTVDLPDALFAGPVNEAVMHQAVVAQLAGRRTGTPTPAPVARSAAAGPSRIARRAPAAPARARARHRITPAAAWSSDRTLAATTSAFRAA